MLLSRPQKVRARRSVPVAIVRHESFRPRLEVLEDRTAPSATFLTRFATPTVDSAPSHITLGPDGALFFTESRNLKIGRISNTGTVTESAGSGFAPPVGITNGHDGFLYFTENG